MSLPSAETDLSSGFPGQAESYSDLNFRYSVICLFLRQDGDIDGCHKLTTHSHPWCSSSGSTEKWTCIWWNMRRQEQKIQKEMDPRKYDETWQIVPLFPNLYSWWALGKKYPYLRLIPSLQDKWISTVMRSFRSIPATSFPPVIIVSLNGAALGASSGIRYTDIKVSYIYLLVF